jgi:urea transport system ATP-binding protein
MPTGLASTLSAGSRQRRINHEQQHRLPPGHRRSHGFVRRVQGGGGLNLYLEQDELRVIIGPNGAGKTTVLDMICGKTKPTSGSIKFRNRNWSALRGARDRARASGASSRRRPSTRISRSSRTWSLLSARPQCVRLPGLPRPRRKSPTDPEGGGRDRPVEHLDIEGAFLSHGQKQWLEIGMLLMQEPDC